ncbi:MAG: type II toxin-antitoxin system VapB family antitoxin [Calditrichaeota bacterium]|nr:MAG: type II toxin-antitoxin system VapB family antitoxin [Calditrichota bacterium]
MHVRVDKQLLKEAMKVGNFKTERGAVEAGLRVLVQLKRQEKIREYRGKLRWEGNPREMRRDT